MRLLRLLIDDYRSRRFRAKLDREDAIYRRAQDAASTDEERMRIGIARVRHHLMALGCDTSEFTDEEIEQGVMRLGWLVCRAGLSTEEALANLDAVGKGLRQLGA